jgi:hypothetical protein
MLAGTYTEFSSTWGFASSLQPPQQAQCHCNLQSMITISNKIIFNAAQIAHTNNFSFRYYYTHRVKNEHVHFVFSARAFRESKI